MEISVVIPVYNLEKYLKKCILSILMQNNKIFEIVIVDDGSKDNSIQIALNLFNEYNYLDYKIITQKNMGVSDSRNNGLLNSEGEFVLFLDGDDYLDPFFSIVIKEEIKNTDIDCICWGFNRVSEFNYKQIDVFDMRYKTLEGTFSNLELLDFILIKKDYWIATGCALFKRESLIKNNLMYESKIANGEDQEFLFKFLINDVKIKIINKNLTNYLIRSSSISNSFNIKKMDVVIALLNVKKQYSLHSNNDFNKYITCINEKIIINYLNSLQSLYKTSSKEDSRELMQMIEKKYPGLIENMNILIRKKTSTSKDFSVKIYLYRLSPKLFKFSFKLYYYLKSKSKGKVNE